jgi:hypothetical protein
MSLPLPPLPYSEPLRLHMIGAGLTRELTPDADAVKRIVKALDLQSLENFTTTITLIPTVSGWRMEGQVMADAVQSCGLTLEPLPVKVKRKFTVNLIEAPERPDQEDEDAEIDIELDDNSPDEIEDGRLDLGAYAVEQLSLSLDPFPRKPGAVFEQPPEPVEISPFAVLKGLQNKSGSSDEG